MNRADLTNTGGQWTYLDTLDFLQQTYLPAINAIVAALGNNVIISGCTVTGSAVAGGWLIYNGELLPLKGGTLEGRGKLKTNLYKDYLPVACHIRQLLLKMRNTSLIKL